MSIYFINIIKDIFATLLLTTYSMFGGSIEEKQVSVVNEENRNYFTIVTTIDTHEDTIKYNSKLPSNKRNVIVEGVDGVSYVDIDGTTKVLKERVDGIIEQGTGHYGEYSGITTGYGADCIGCSGTVACRTREGKNHNLINDGIYYKDQQYGDVRIVAADNSLFSCGTIIEVNNGRQKPFLAIVLDTGIDMRRAWRNQGVVHLDVAFKHESDPGTYDVTVKNNGAKFSVQRWGW